MVSSIVDEYSKLLTRRAQIEAELLTLPKGYISKKVIKGKPYSYLQDRVFEKVVSKYLKADVVDDIAKQIETRKSFGQELKQILIRLTELEQASRLLDSSISRKLMLFRISYGMDNLDVKEKVQCTSFSSAMTSIEGFPISTQATQDIEDWKNGLKSYLSMFEDTLCRYGFIKEE
jgi:hypothetical protein